VGKIEKITANWWPLEYFESVFDTIFMSSKLYKKSNQVSNYVHTYLDRKHSSTQIFSFLEIRYFIPNVKIPLLIVREITQRRVCVKMGKGVGVG
jgi:hypothetical protein